MRLVSHRNMFRHSAVTDGSSFEKQSLISARVWHSVHRPSQGNTGTQTGPPCKQPRAGSVAPGPCNPSPPGASSQTPLSRQQGPDGGRPRSLGLSSGIGPERSTLSCCTVWLQRSRSPGNGRGFHRCRPSLPRKMPGKQRESHRK